MGSFEWKERYEFAQAALFASDRVANGAVYPVWVDDRHFWYRRRATEGQEFRVVDAATGETRAVVAVAALARALEKALDAPVTASSLIVGNLQFDLEHRSIVFDAYGKTYRYTLSEDVLAPEEKRSDANWLTSPDGRTAIVSRASDLWLRDLGGTKETLLTTDGATFYAYGQPPAAMRGLRARMGDAKPEALWSPDGRWVLTLQTDDRHVPDVSVCEYAPAGGVRPRVHANKTSLPADPKVTEFRLIAIEAATGRQVEARYPRLTAVRMNTTPFSAGTAWWSADSRTAYFVDIERGERAVHVVAFDVATGASPIIFSERADTPIEVSVNVYAPALIAPLPETNELVWYSERTGRGHLYLYDLASGEFKHAVTSGPWQVRDVLRVDAVRREVFFLAAGIEPDESPYVVKPCVAPLDGGEVRILSGGIGEHRVWRAGEMALSLTQLEGFDPRTISGVSPSGDYFVETVSTVKELPATYLRARDGRLIATLERADWEAPPHWLPPEPVRCKAADGETDIYGLLFSPVGIHDESRVPVIDLIYGGPQLAFVPQASFAGGLHESSTYLDAMHLSALGAFVLIVDGRGTAYREQAFRTASYGAAHTASNLEDHVAAIKQLAAARPRMDLGRVGITGFSGGGYMAVHAALRFGDFFKVAVAGGGNYDQALFWHSWGERYHGVFEAGHYAVQAAKSYAAGLTGKLMLVHGLMDEGCHPAGLFQLVQALIEADKDADLVLLPRAGHDWTGYGMRRRWEYFAQHLFGVALPKLQSFTRPLDDLFAKVAANASVPTCEAGS